MLLATVLGVTGAILAPRLLVIIGAGDAAIAMRVLCLANAINIVLGPCLIFGLGPFPALGVTGGAVATTIGRGTGAIYALSRLMRGRGLIAITRKDVRVKPQLMYRLITLVLAIRGRQQY